jgi:hypothetical protein
MMEHPGEKYIDPRLLALIKKSEKDGGIFLNDVPKRALVEVQTNNSIYTIAIIDVKKAEVIVKGNNKHLATPKTCFLLGSTYGGSMLKLGWIGVDMHLQVSVIGGPILTTSPIRFIKIYLDEKMREEMMKAAG